ncbi:hypothetical protein EYF80_016417 [Liparis tanakae]|uniref:Uncharacterized protein n=1 Tax=Liparis tanakae TaxID=230148 RepID=A0A4Z2I7F3_9TELE|nr:hypothetical protein EYF80_016417 [Liparis tanakae]
MAHLKSTRTAMKNVWKLQFRLIDGDVQHAPHDDQGVKRIPRIDEIVLQRKEETKSVEVKHAVDWAECRLQK